MKSLVGNYKNLNYKDFLYGKTFKDTLKLYTLGVQTKTIYACVGKLYMS